MDYVVPLATQLARMYFNPVQRGRGRGRRTRRRGRGGSSRGQRQPQRAPTRTIMQGSFNGSIRQYFNIDAVNSYYKTLAVSDLVGDQYASLAAQFSEVRVNSIRAYYEPSKGTGAEGLYAACLFDVTNESSASTLSYGRVVASPGSVVRKLWQPSGFHWKWTEPSDAEFVHISSTNRILVFQVIGQASITIPGELIIDASITLRNQGQSVAESLERHISLIGPDQLSADKALELSSMMLAKFTK